MEHLKNLTTKELRDTTEWRDMYSRCMKDQKAFSSKRAFLRFVDILTLTPKTDLKNPMKSFVVFKEAMQQAREEERIERERNLSKLKSEE